MTRESGCSVRKKKPVRLGGDDAADASSVRATSTGCAWLMASNTGGTNPTEKVTGTGQSSSNNYGDCRLLFCVGHGDFGLCQRSRAPRWLFARNTGRVGWKAAPRAGPHAPAPVVVSPRVRAASNRSLLAPQRWRAHQHRDGDGQHFDGLPIPRQIVLAPMAIPTGTPLMSANTSAPKTRARLQQRCVDELRGQDGRRRQGYWQYQRKRGCELPPQALPEWVSALIVCAAMPLRRRGCAQAEMLFTILTRPAAEAELLGRQRIQAPARSCRSRSAARPRLLS